MSGLAASWRDRARSAIDRSGMTDYEVSYRAGYHRSYVHKLLDAQDARRGVFSAALDRVADVVHTTTEWIRDGQLEVSLWPLVVTDPGFRQAGAMTQGARAYYVCSLASTHFRGHLDPDTLAAYIGAEDAANFYSELQGQEAVAPGLLAGITRLTGVPVEWLSRGVYALLPEPLARVLLAVHGPWRAIASLRDWFCWTEAQMARYLRVEVAEYTERECEGAPPEVMARWADLLLVSDRFIVRGPEAGVEMWGPGVQRARAAFRFVLRECPPFHVFDDRLTWALRWLLAYREMGGRVFTKTFLAGVLGVHVSVFSRLADREYESGDDFDAPGAEIVDRAAAFLDVPLSWITRGMTPTPSGYEWQLLVTDLQSRGISPAALHARIDHVADLVTREQGPPH